MDFEIFDDGSALEGLAWLQDRAQGLTTQSEAQLLIKESFKRFKKADQWGGIHAEQTSSDPALRALFSAARHQEGRQLSSHVWRQLAQRCAGLPGQYEEFEPHVRAWFYFRLHSALINRYGEFPS